jgi:hypothetical protein
LPALASWQIGQLKPGFAMAAISFVIGGTQ